jgi:hypothetical protein
VPSDVFGRAMLVASLARFGELDEARNGLTEIQRIKPDFNLTSFNQPFQPSQLADLAAGLQLARLPR